MNKALKELQTLQPAVQYVEELRSREKKKKRKDGDTALGVTNFITGQSGALGLIILIKTL